MDKEIFVGNRIIAEFMGFTFINGRFERSWKWKDDNDHWHESAESFKERNYLNWNMLMLVVQKIKKVGFSKGVEIGDVISCSDIELSCQISKVSGLSIFCQIEHVWSAVVGFIVWYSTVRKSSLKSVV